MSGRRVHIVLRAAARAADGAQRADATCPKSNPPSSGSSTCAWRVWRKWLCCPSATSSMSGPPSSSWSLRGIFVPRLGGKCCSAAAAVEYVGGGAAVCMNRDDVYCAWRVDVVLCGLRSTRGALCVRARERCAAVAAAAGRRTRQTPNGRNRRVRTEPAGDSGLRTVHCLPLFRAGPFGSCFDLGGRARRVVQHTPRGRHSPPFAKQRLEPTQAHRKPSFDIER